MSEDDRRLSKEYRVPTSADFNSISISIVTIARLISNPDLSTDRGRSGYEIIARLDDNVRKTRGD